MRSNFTSAVLKARVLLDISDLMIPCLYKIVKWYRHLDIIDSMQELVMLVQHYNVHSFTVVLLSYQVKGLIITVKYPFCNTISGHKV